MSFGLYTSASGMLTAMHRMDIAANNLANLETIGFKMDVTAPKARASAREEDGLSLPSSQLLETLGAGPHVDRTRTSMSQGTLESTRNDLDVALRGKGFFRLQSGDGRDLLTRDGRFTLNSQGQLVQASTGTPVLSDGGSTITLSANGPISIDKTGQISQNGTPIARLGVVDVENSSALSKRGDGAFANTGDADEIPATAEVVQRHIERSSVNPVSAMLEISSAERAVSSGARVIRSYDEVLGRLIGTFGRIA
jgi:flagellar basal-body rod protein FlgF